MPLSLNERSEAVMNVYPELVDLSEESVLPDALQRAADVLGLDYPVDDLDDILVAAGDDDASDEPPILPYLTLDEFRALLGTRDQGDRLHLGQPTPPQPPVAIDVPPEYEMTDDARRVWREHCAINARPLEAGSSETAVSTITGVEHLQLAPPVQDFLTTTLVRFVRQIDQSSAAVAALFYGPRFNMLVLPRRPRIAFSEFHFILHHICGHHLLGHFSDSSPSLRMEYRPGCTPRFLADDTRYVREESEADSDAYQSLTRSLRGAAAECSPPVATRRSPWSWAAQLSGAFSLARRFVGPIALVRGADRHVFLVIYESSEPSSGGIKRWIPSREVLSRVLLSAWDVVRVSDDELARLEDGEILLDPEDVETAHEWLARASRRSYMPNLLAPESVRLAALGQGDAALALSEETRQRLAKPDRIVRPAETLKDTCVLEPLRS